MKSCLVDMMSRMLLIALERLEILVVALSMDPISSVVSMRMGDMIDSIASSNATKMIKILVQRVSACNVAVG